MKAIDRAALWTEWLEQVGFDIECETSTDIVRNEYLTVWARKGHEKVVFTILMNSKFTRFVTGSTGYVLLRKFTNKPSEMSTRVSSVLHVERWKMQSGREEVSA